MARVGARYSSLREEIAKAVGVAEALAVAADKAVEVAI
jgi:hypothetical protein